MHEPLIDFELCIHVLVMRLILTIDKIIIYWV